MTDLTHLDALQTRLRHEREYLAKETRPRAIAYREIWIRQIENEIEAEYAFLGIDPTIPQEFAEMSNADLLAELMA